MSAPTGGILVRPEIEHVLNGSITTAFFKFRVCATGKLQRCKFGKKRTITDRWYSANAPGAYVRQRWEDGRMFSMLVEFDEQVMYTVLRGDTPMTRPALLEYTFERQERAIGPAACVTFDRVVAPFFHETLTARVRVPYFTETVADVLEYDPAVPDLLALLRIGPAAASLGDYLRSRAYLPVRGKFMDQLAKTRSKAYARVYAHDPCAGADYPALIARGHALANDGFLVMAVDYMFMLIIGLQTVDKIYETAAMREEVVARYDAAYKWICENRVAAMMMVADPFPM